MKENKKLSSLDWKNYIINNNYIIAFVVLIIISSILSDNFLTPGNFVNLMKQQAAPLLVAFGLLFTLIIGGIDLSVGSTACLSGIIMGTTLMKWNWDGPGGLILGILLSVAAAGLVGLINGLLISGLRLPAFIVTLSMQFSIRGLANMLCNGQPIRALNETWAYKSLIGFAAPEGNLFGIPFPFILALVFAVCLSFVLRQSSYGRLITAAGSNETAVQLAGVRVKRYQISVYVISGILAGIAGILVASRATVFSPTAANQYEMNAIAGAVIGGASFTGGTGCILGTVLGVFILSMLENIMSLLALPPYPQQVIKGAIIILAVLLQSVTAKRRVKARKK